MWCPDCKTEFTGSEQRCPDCGAELIPELEPVVIGWGKSAIGELSDKWPVDSSGEPVAAAFLTHCTATSLEDEMTVNMLGAFGIPAIRRYPNDGSFGRVMLGMSGDGTDIYVPVTLLEDARILLNGDDSAGEDDLN
jgi:hypothetical protein